MHEGIVTYVENAHGRHSSVLHGTHPRVHPVDTEFFKALRQLPKFHNHTKQYAKLFACFNIYVFRTMGRF